jgi:hypothetical protein
LIVCTFAGADDEAEEDDGAEPEDAGAVLEPLELEEHPANTSATLDAVATAISPPDL